MTTDYDNKYEMRKENGNEFKRTKNKTEVFVSGMNGPYRPQVTGQHTASHKCSLHSDLTFPNLVLISVLPKLNKHYRALKWQLFAVLVLLVTLKSCIRFNCHKSKDGRLLNYFTWLCARISPTFQRYFPWRWKQQTHLKRRYISTTGNCATTQNMIILRREVLSCGQISGLASSALPNH